MMEEKEEKMIMKEKEDAKVWSGRRSRIVRGNRTLRHLMGSLLF